MPKSKSTKASQGLKKFKMPDGTTRSFPDWADKPLFAFPNDDALRKTMTANPPKSWRKTIGAGRKSRR